MRLAFMGTPDFAVPTLDALHEAGHEIAMVYSQPPRRAGRGKQVTPTPVDARAQALGLPVRTPISLKSADEHAYLAALDLDVAVVAAYGLILPQPILDAPRLGCLNVPWVAAPAMARRGAAVQRAILAGGRRDWRHHHADGGRAGHRPHARHGRHADRRSDGGRDHRRAGRFAARR